MNFVISNNATIEVYKNMKLIVFMKDIKTSQNIIEVKCNSIFKLFLHYFTITTTAFR